MQAIVSSTRPVLIQITFNLVSCSVSITVPNTKNDSLLCQLLYLIILPIFGLVKVFFLYLTLIRKNRHGYALFLGVFFYLTLLIKLG